MDGPKRIAAALAASFGALALAAAISPGGGLSAIGSVTVPDAVGGEGIVAP